jgi:hypothetical protein
MAEHHANAKHQPHAAGTMDIAEQQRTFQGFLRVAGLTIVVVVTILLLLTFRI